MKAASKTSIFLVIFLVILIVDLVFFILIRQYFPEGYDWMISTTSFNAGISLDVTRSVFIIGGFVIALISVSFILYLGYGMVKKAVKSV